MIGVVLAVRAAMTIEHGQRAVGPVDHLVGDIGQLILRRQQYVASE